MLEIIMLDSYMNTSMGMAHDITKIGFFGGKSVLIPTTMCSRGIDVLIYLGIDR